MDKQKDIVLTIGELRELLRVLPDGIMLEVAWEDNNGNGRS